jgi:hypothetical protein
MSPTTIFDVPVNVKFVAINISSSSLAAPVPVSVIEPDVPNAIERVLVLSELNAPVVKVKLFRSNVPAVNRDLELGAHDKASCRVVVIPAPLTVNVSICLPVEVSVPLPTVVKSVLVYVPPDASVNP